ncbi:MAG: WecB/TagA/CpsF family glycosyltransferase [Rubripirellula sp.]|nr:WecB/TagA/CpsF family glycosyltransferase [Rubripirellula sp.]
MQRARHELLLVAFGQPKGELWIHQRYNDHGVPVSIQLGASFAFVAATARRAPQVWQRCGME